ncbi:MAG: response regulator, partial [Proteobacteria bacterium]|nr:response regulator [Pseudomonadota bacterium]
RPGWTNKVVDNYTYSFRKIGDSIVYVTNSGNMDFFNVETHYRLMEDFIKEAGIKYPFIEVRDVERLKGKPPSRVIKKQKSYLIENQEKMAGFIFCNAPFWLRAVAAAGINRYKTSTQVIVCKNYTEALTKAKIIAENKPVLPEGKSDIFSFDMLEFRPQWQYENKDRQIFYRNGVIPGKLFYSQIQADTVDMENFSRIVPMFEAVFKEGVLTNSRYIRIVDYSRVGRSSLKARKAYAQLQNRLNRAYGCSPSVSYVSGANLFTKTAIKIFSRFVNQTFVFVDTVEQAFDKINHLSIKKDKDQIIRVAQKDIEEINDLCGMLVWEEDEAKKFNDIQISEQNSLFELYETISLVRNDLIELRQNEIEQAKKLKKAVQLAEASNQAKSDFLANMSHELRTPLNGIIGMLDLVTDSCLTSEQKEMIDSAKAGADRLQNLVDDIFDFTLLDDCTIPIKHENFDLKSVMTSINRLMLEKALKKNITYDFSMNNDIPTDLYGDPGSLYKILNHIIGNAIKFVAAGSVSFNISKHKETDTAVQLVFEIVDTGIGIPVDMQDTLFDLFTQVDTSTTRKFEGAGIGLALSRKLVNLMGGDIGFDSQMDKGSRFWVTIEYEKAGISNHSNSIYGKGLSEQVREKTMKVMVVDDNKMNQKVAGNMLKKMGYEVLTADNGLEAVDMFHLYPDKFDLIFMDIQMPVMGGEEAVKRIRQIEEKYNIHTPIIALTANATHGARERFLAAGMDEYMTKPVKKEVLAEIIRCVV